MGHRSSPRVPYAALTVALFTLLAFGCEGAPTDAFELSGVVTVLNESGEDGGAIANARIIFISDTLLVAETQTDDSGRYRLRVMTDHPFGQVRAEADGFITGEDSVFFDTPQRRVDLQLRRLPM
jgi:hypothetical protein